jgi:DNA polymerase III sliding clamp (beta) subunit (PCNA family)
MDWGNQMNRKDLVQKLELVGSALANNDLVPIFQCFCFSGNEVCCYNDALGIVTPCETPTYFAVNGPVLLGLLTNSLAEDVEFSSDEGSIVIKAGRSTFKLPYHPKTDFLFEAPELGKEAVLLPIDEDLISGLNACLLTSSTDNAQPAFMGVCLANGKKYKTLYSTDGDAISRYTLKSPATKAPNRVLPNSFCQALIKIMTETKATKGSILINEEWAVASLETEFTIYGRLLQVDNPLDYEKEISQTKPLDGERSLIPKALDHALSRARVLADPESAKTILLVEGDRLKLLTETAMGVVRDSVQMPVQPPVKANVSSQLVQRCIGLCDQMRISDNCVEFWTVDNSLYILTSNMGE